EKLSQLIFSGEFETGSSLVERKLASRLGVSRIPMREALSSLVAQGALEGGRKGEGVRIRRYTVDEIRKLYDYRAAIEGGVARAAATSASESDILRLELICDGMQAILDEEDFSKWSSLDVKFHEALAEASHNERFELSLKSLLRECFYVFYILSRQKSRRELSSEEFASHKRQAIADHRVILECLKSHDADGAEARSRLHILRTSDRVIRTSIETDLEN
ncbi:MAG: GntR family transcriptional regulator, partial [Planctomycetaceae bacterium]|nr:GntR family transcriptional regulator [Planctomycetaceae bacterium]